MKEWAMNLQKNEARDRRRSLGHSTVRPSSPHSDDDLDRQRRRELRDKGIQLVGKM